MSWTFGRAVSFCVHPAELHCLLRQTQTSLKVALKVGGAVVQKCFTIALS